MSAPQDTFTYWRSQVAILTRKKAPWHEQDEARRRMNAARLRDQIEAALAMTPPLTDDERGRLASMLAPGGAK